MLKAWTADNFLHIRWKIKVNFILTSYVFEKAEENVYKYQNSLGDVLDMKNLHLFGIKNQKTLSISMIRWQSGNYFLFWSAVPTFWSLLWF